MRTKILFCSLICFLFSFHASATVLRLDNEEKKTEKPQEVQFSAPLSKKEKDICCLQQFQQAVLFVGDLFGNCIDRSVWAFYQRKILGKSK